jgi:hypothetical protein
MKPLIPNATRFAGTRPLGAGRGELVFVLI